MSVSQIYSTLHDLLVEWLTNAGFRQEHGTLEKALDHYGFDHVDADDILACLPLVAEDLPPVYQQAIYEHMSAMSDTDSGSYFEVNQGGGSYDAVQENGSAGAAGGSGGSGGHGGGSPMETVVRHIEHIQNITENNYSWIDDSGDVTTSVTALGDVDFDQIVASGAGAVAADGDVEGVNTGTNYGVIAGDDAEGSEVTSVFGDGNVTGDFGDDATVVTGDDNVLANDSTVIDGDFDGGFIGGDVTADRSALNFGDGDVAQDNSVDNSVRIDDSYNTDESVHDSGNTTIKDSYDHEYTDKSDNSVNDSGNYTDNSDNSIDDSGNYTDNSDNSIDDSGNTDIDTEWRSEYEHTEVHEENTYTSTDVNVEIDDSLNEAPGHHGGHEGGHEFHG